MKLKYKVEISTNLWIPLSYHIYIDSKRKPWHTSFVMAPAGPPFYTSTKRGRSEHNDKRGWGWPLSKGRAGGEAGARISGTLPDTG